MKNTNEHRYNAANERMKFTYRKHIRRKGKKDEKTLIAELKHIRDYEIFTDFANFTQFNDDVADKYIKNMFDRELSLSYITSNIRALKEFLKWLREQKGYRSKLNYNHIDYLDISNNQRATAKAPEHKKAYKYEQILKTIRLMPEQTLIQKRNKAIVSLNALCSLRISELRTVKIKNLIEEDGNYFIYVTPRDMKVKKAKTRYANFMSLPEDIKANVLNWLNYLIKQGFKDKDPLFPQIPSQFNQNNLLETTLTKEEIKSGTTIRDIFKKAFEDAGFEYIHPHSFRRTIARFAANETPSLLNAVSKSLGHSSIDTTIRSYGALSEYEKRDIISNFKFDFDNQGKG
jgi:integrase/recombinase XerD